MVREQHRLCALQVRVARDHRPSLALGEVEQRAPQCREALDGPVAGGADEHPEVGGDLVVARARGVEPPRGLADALRQRGLDVEVDVLAVLAELEVARGDIRLDGPQAGGDGVAVVVGDDALGGEHPRVRDRACDVLAVEPAVEGDGGSVRLDERVGGALEAAAPELGFAVGGWSRRAVLGHGSRLHRGPAVRER